MSVHNNAVCDICGKEYYMCISCAEQRRLAPWKIYTDTSEHFKIYQILHGYSTGVYSKHEAKIKLENVDLSDMETFRDKTKNYIKNILTEDISLENNHEDLQNIENDFSEKKTKTEVEDKPKKPIKMTYKSKSKNVK